MEGSDSTNHVCVKAADESLVMQGRQQQRLLPRGGVVASTATKAYLQQKLLQMTVVRLQLLPSPAVMALQRVMLLRVCPPCSWSALLAMVQQVSFIADATIQLTL